VHIPDGFLNAPVSLGTVVLAASATAVALKKSKGSIEAEVAPMVGLTAVFIFAAQMLNFPVAVGTSGHLLGGALATILVGPWAGLLAMVVVLGLQTLIFADGGLSAIGSNVTVMGVVTVLVAWLVLKIGKSIAKTKTGLVAVSAIAALISVPASALGFVVLFAIGGTDVLDLTAVTTAMISVHVLIGIGEAAITALTVSAVLASRPDLVWAARSLLPKKELEIRSQSEN
jgi:cobalt/nickel transport system permease protein